MKNLYEYINEASLLDPTQDKVGSAANRIADITSFPKKSNCYKDEDGYWTYTWVLSPDGLKEYLQDESAYKKVKVAKTNPMPENAIQLCFTRKVLTGIDGDAIGYVQFIGEIGRYRFYFRGGAWKGDHKAEAWDSKNFKQKAYDFFCKIRDDKDIFQKWAKLKDAQKGVYKSIEWDIEKLFS